MVEKTINTRIMHKHATEAVWATAPDFIPINGELIIYDEDKNHEYKRIKIGDGTTKISVLKFVDENVRSLLEELSNNFDSFNETINETIDDLQTQVDQNDLQVGTTQPSFPCSWFKVTSEG
jgi:hypothetical protein